MPCLVKLILMTKLLVRWYCWLREFKFLNSFLCDSTIDIIFRKPFSFANFEVNYEIQSELLVSDGVCGSEK